MGLFGSNYNRKVEKTIKKLEKNGFSPDAYKTRKHCGSCKYYSSSGICNLNGHRRPVSELCSNWWGK